MNIIIKLSLFVFIFFLSTFLFCCQTSTDTDKRIKLVTIINEGCSPCELLLYDSTYVHCSSPKTVYDMEKTSTNRLLGQALWNVGFPTTYFITPNNEIVGITQGFQEFRREADSIIYHQKHFEDIGMERFNINKNAILPLLTHSYKAFLAYIEKDYVQTKIEAKNSLEKGSSFFCNYLLYKVYNIMQQPDSASYYKKNALNHQSDADLFLYSDLIEELHENN